MSADAEPFPRRHHWPVTLRHGDVVLSPIRRADRRDWDEVRARNHAWLTPWEATAPPGSGGRAGSFGELVRALQAAARQGAALPWIIRYAHDGRDPVLAGQLTVNNITWGSALMASIGYWVDERWAGRGIVPAAVALACDYCFEVLGLHRIEIAIRPENGKSLRVVEKLAFRPEGLRPGFLHINDQWRDHLIFALNSDEVPDGLRSRLRDTPRRLS
ncbi:ribosomal-protein-alanine N-acetyltransferase [Naumannella cuiyingiana]|uniref:Ribosomal-protein-alanine N-acetyltransferase n=1 Tax=Naumannella cuiyingiana TaxID=1347891 RepID=A0A7Z0D9Z0_9ACTN|nr:GNAT family protein [Naumannella cuiyingiana]NYI71696.1 ribosomal-protein-alanine N-acetyltransferase [Naumannella cuiyingiana]